MWRKAWALCLLLHFLFLLPGCGAAAHTPVGTARAFSDAVRRERYAQAYELMSEDYRRRVRFDQFRRMLEDYPEEARDIADTLADAQGPSVVTAVVPIGRGEELTLTQERGGWRLTGNIADFYDQTTPRAALRSFVRAMERRRYEVVLRFVPKADREGMTVGRMKQVFEEESKAETERLLAALRENLKRPIEVVGDHATMPYGDRYSVQFVREDGLWRIEDPDGP